MTDAEKLAAIQHIVDVNEQHADDEEGDRHLASQGYAMEAIGAVLGDWPESPVVRQFLEAG